MPAMTEDGIPQPVLHIEHRGGKPFARNGLGHHGGCERAPGGVHGFAGAQAPGEGKGRHFSRSH